MAMVISFDKGEALEDMWKAAVDAADTLPRGDSYNSKAYSQIRCIAVWVEAPSNTLATSYTRKWLSGSHSNVILPIIA